MKISQTFTIAIALLASQACNAQNQTLPNISKADVSRVLKTLSADEMLGRNALKPNEIAKAAEFISAEFKSAGLKFLGSNNSYLQNFSLVSIKPLGGDVLINGTKLNDDSYIISSYKESVNLKTFPKTIKIEAGDDFFAKYREVSQTETDVLVLVDESFKDSFSRLRNFLKRGNMVFNNEGPTIVYILLNAEVKSVDIDFKNAVSSIPMFNVAGILPGKSKPNEYVIFSGHYDHLGVIKAVNQDSIANGADDDASGVTAVIELAKYFANKKNNERSIIFVAFTAEEIGGYGSQFFSKQLNPDQVMAMFNIEMIGKTSKFGKNNAFITGFEKSDFGTILQKNLQQTDFKFYPDPYPKQNLFYRSDNATLARLGVPAHTISSDQIDTDKLYHSVDDEFESIDIGNITEIIKAIAISSQSIISGKDTPTRVTEVK